MKDLSVRSAVVVQAWVVALKRRTEGATAAEYALLVALIAIVAVGAVTAAGTQVSNIFGQIATAI